MAYSGCFSLGGNLDFLDFHQKMFYNINYWPLKLRDICNQLLILPLPSPYYSICLCEVIVITIQSVLS